MTGANAKIKKIYVGTQQVRPKKDTSTYTISNIPTNDSNVYVNVAQSGKTIQSVTFRLTADIGYNKHTYATISSNNSNSSRYGLYISGGNGAYPVGITVRGRLNGGTETGYRTTTDGFSSTGTNVIEYTINRDGNCTIVCNGVTTNYTATGAELNVLQTIMNLSNMNVYSAQTASILSGNKVDVEVSYS